MLWITEDAKLVCPHRGNVTISYSQNFVTIHHRKALVEPDPEGQPILSCPNYVGATKPCTATLIVQDHYSDFIRIGGKPVCLEKLWGYTDGTPPGQAKYSVQVPGQNLVAQR